MPKPVFSRDDYFKMLEGFLAPQPLVSPLLEQLRTSILKRKQFGGKLPPIGNFSRS